MIDPATSDLNFTPSSTDDGSDTLAVTGADELDQIEHGEHDGADGVTAADAADAGPVPTLFVADTVNVYAVPFVNPDTVTLVAGGAPDTTTGVPATDPANGVTVYDEIAAPPSDDGADHDTTAEAFPATADTPDGAPGTVAGGAGVTALEGEDSGPVPIAFVADTVNVYAVPLVRPVTVAVVAGGFPVTVTAVCFVEPT